MIDKDPGKVYVLVNTCWETPEGPRAAFDLVKTDDTSWTGPGKQVMREAAVNAISELYINRANILKEVWGWKRDSSNHRTVEHVAIHRSRFKQPTISTIRWTILDVYLTDSIDKVHEICESIYKSSRDKAFPSIMYGQYWRDITRYIR